MKINDIARLAGVSASTVSKVMNHKDENISQETRDKVLKIAKDYSYTPYASAIPNYKTYQIGLIFRTIQSSSLFEGLIYETSKLGYDVSIMLSNNSPKEELKAITRFTKQHVDLILLEPCSNSEETLLFLENKQIPYFLFNCQESSSFHIDYHSIGYSAAKSLIDLGHTNIAFLGFDDENTARMIEGYKKCLFDNQLALNQSPIFSDINTFFTQNMLCHSFSAIICSNEKLAFQLYSKCKNISYDIPEQLSIISLVEKADSASMLSPLSHFVIPSYEFGQFIGKCSVNFLEKGIRDSFIFCPDFKLNHFESISSPNLNPISKIVVVGSINMDTYLNVSSLPTSGVSVRTNTSSQYPGGKGANQSVGVAKLGHSVSLIGNVGNDIESNLIYETLEQNGVDASYVRRHENCSTGKAYIIVDPNGDSLISILSGANDVQNSSEIETAFNHVSYTLISTEISMTTIEKVCYLTHKNGGKTILKPSSCDKLPQSVLSNIDILIPNQKEINGLLPNLKTLSEQASYYLSLGVETVIITLGANGCFVKTKETETSYPAANVNSVDNTGAGDAFIAAFASYLLYGYTLDCSIQIATYAAGLSTTREGAMPSLIDKSTLETYIRRINPSLIDKAYTNKQDDIS